jgi:hypothetical protein
MERVAAIKRTDMRFKIAFVLLLTLSGTVRAQHVPPLERIISISFAGEKIDAVLLRISKEAKFTFSYSPTILNLNESVNEDFHNKSIREVLTEVLGQTVTFKERGNYIILNKAPVVIKKASNAAPPLTISGYVYNAESGEKISEVSVYDKKTLTAAVTNQFGFFNLKIDKPEEETLLSFNKVRFLDTLINVPHEPIKHFLNIPLSAEAPKIIEEEIPEAVVVADTASRVKAEPMVAEEERKPARESEVNMVNIRDTLYRDFQVSFVPFVGTNHKLSGNVINNYSFNILGGYSLGTQELEVAGLFNIDRGDVKRIQAAGMFNVVGGDVTGVQAAGLGNMNEGSLKGGQFAGLYNLNAGVVEGPQFAGLFNLNLKEADGAQFAGLFNINGKEARGAQFAGLFNIQPKDYRGPQFAGLFNIAGKKLSGMQASALLNYSRKVRGTQIGFINVSDSIRGVPLGFLSFSSHGYHKVEIAADEIFYTNLSFRTGVRQFYNIFTAGIKPENTIGLENVWSFGYGLGTAPRIYKWLFLNFDITSNHVNNGSFTNSLSLLNKLYIGADIQLTKGFSVTGGVTLNGYLSDPEFSSNPSLFTHYTPGEIYEYSYANNNNLKMWWGAKVGLRFF